MTHVRLNIDMNRPGSGAYEWFNIERLGERIGRIRMRKTHTRAVIFSINIYDRYKGCGYGRAVIEHFKKTFNELTADRVRNQAVGFWVRMGFREVPGDCYTWRRSAGARGMEYEQNLLNVSV